jgi:hypothetical protein
MRFGLGLWVRVMSYVISVTCLSELFQVDTLK